MSRIEGLSREQFKVLSQVLSYRVEGQSAYFSGSWRNPVRYLLGTRGDFPTGLLYLVESFLDDFPADTEIYVRDTRSVPPPYAPANLYADSPLGVEPYPEQLEAVESALKKHRGIICAPTGVGKSLIIAHLLRRLRVRTLVVVPTLELKRQLTETLQKACWKEDVGSLGSCYAVENVAALDPKVKLKGYDCVIIDEFHHSGAKSYRQLNQKAWTEVYYKFGLTATPFRSKDTEQLLLESVLSQVIYRIEYKTAVDKGYIVPVEAYYVDLQETEVQGNPTLWPSMYSEFVVNHKVRNDLIKDLLLRLHCADKPTLCLVKEINHGEKLTSNGAFLFANGQDGESGSLIEAFNSRKINCLIGTTGILGEGVDTRPCEYVIIAGLGKSKNAFMQQVGRGLRKYPGKESCKVILFKDKSHKWTLEHFRAQCKYLRGEYGVVPVKLDLPTY